MWWSTTQILGLPIILKAHYIVQHSNEKRSPFSFLLGVLNRDGEISELQLQSQFSHYKMHLFSTLLKCYSASEWPSQSMKRKRK
jgi:hypothetical protein